MVLFHRRKIGERINGKKRNDYKDNSFKDKVLEGQVKDLQEELKSLSKQLVEMQGQVQTTGTMSSRPVKIPTTSLSTRRDNGPSLEIDKSPKNPSFQRKKWDRHNFIPNEIDFDLNKVAHNGKGNRQDIPVFNMFPEEEPPPVHEIVTESKADVEKSFSKTSRNDVGDNVRITNKAISVDHSRKIHLTSLKSSEDRESTISCHRSTYTTENGRKVKRIIRKVKAAQPTTIASTPEFSRESMPKEKEEILRSFSPTNRINRLKKEPESHTQSRSWGSGAFINKTKDFSVGVNLLAHDRIENNRYDRILSRRTRTSSSAQSQKVQHMARQPITNQCVLNESKQRRINISEKRLNKSFESFDENLQAEYQGNVDDSDTLDGKAILHQFDHRAIDESKPLLSIKHGPLGRLRRQASLERPTKTRTESFSQKKQGCITFVNTQINKESKQTQNFQATSLDLTSSRRGTNLISNQMNSIEMAPSYKRDLLADIRVGFKLETSKKIVKQSVLPKLSARNAFQESMVFKGVEYSIATNSSSTKSPNVNSNETSSMASQKPRKTLLEGIKAGVTLKEVDRSLLRGPKQSAKNILIVDNNGKSSMASGNPRNNILEGIKAGVKLKEVDRSLQGPKHRETPMSILLAKIQERKEECLRHRCTFGENPEGSEIDW